MRDAPCSRRECCHAAVDAAVEEGDEAAAVVDDMDQLGEMARWRRRGRYGKRYAEICLKWRPVRYLNAAFSERTRPPTCRHACKHAETPPTSLSLSLSLSLFCRVVAASI